MSPVEILLIGLPICLVLGIPVFISLGVVSLIALLKTNIPLVIIPQTIYEGMDQFPLLAIPCFILAGTIMEKTGLKKTEAESVDEKSDDKKNKPGKEA